MYSKVTRIAFVLSLILHAVFIGVYQMDQRQKKAQQLLAQEEARKNKVFKVNFLPVKQVVQTAESKEKKVVDKSFLGKENNYFERQTVAREVDKFRLGKGKNSQAENKNFASAKPNAQPKSALARLGLGLPMLVQKNKNLKNNSKDESLLKEVASMSSASNDYVKDIPLGDMSKLNTDEYKHFGFFQRIRSQLEQHWGSTLKDTAKKIYRKGRKIASESDFITNLEVELDKSGKIVAIRIIGTSGVKELDDAAIESFNKAGPFPNPPQDLVVNGQAIIKWGFVVKS